MSDSASEPLCTGPAPGASGDPAAARAGGDPLRVLVVDADRLTLDLIEAWLVDDGCSVVDEGAGSAADPAAADRAPFNLLLVDMPYPRQGGVERVQRLAAAHPGTPILVLSATFFASVECSGACARALCVAGVLPKPITREALVGAVRRLARRSAPP